MNATLNETLAYLAPLVLGAVIILSLVFNLNPIPVFLSMCLALFLCEICKRR